MTDAGGAALARPPRASVAVILLAAVMLGIAVGLVVHLVVRPGSGRAPAALARGAGTGTASARALHGEASWPAGAVMAPAISGLHDQSGSYFSLASLHGRTVALMFFDSFCNQACPLEGRALAAAEHALPAAQRPVVVVVSVNPRDTPASTRGAARKWGIAAVGQWHWLRGTHAELARIWKAYRIYVAPPRDGDIAHTEALYLLGRRGDQRSGYVYPFASHFVTSDLRTLAREGAG